MSKRKKAAALICTVLIELAVITAIIIVAYLTRQSYLQNSAKPGQPVMFRVYIEDCERGFLELTPLDSAFESAGYLIVNVDEYNHAYIGSITKVKPSDSIVYIDNYPYPKNHSELFDYDDFGAYWSFTFATSSQVGMIDAYSVFKDKTVYAVLEINEGEIFVKDVLIDGQSANKWLKENGY